MYKTYSITRCVYYLYYDDFGWDVDEVRMTMGWWMICVSLSDAWLTFPSRRHWWPPWLKMSYGSCDGDYDACGDQYCFGAVRRSLKIDVDDRYGDDDGGGRGVKVRNRGGGDGDGTTYSFVWRPPLSCPIFYWQSHGCCCVAAVLVIVPG
jgi:hypothetical protein